MHHSPNVIQRPGCDDTDCTDPVDYLSKFGAYCDYHAWTYGVRRWSDGPITTSNQEPTDE